MNINLSECPNCGSSALVEISPTQRQCEYCGSMFTSPRTALIECPRCGFDNEQGVLYCQQCGLAIAKWAAGGRITADPAIISIIVTIAGSFFVPIGGAILGLILAYKARDQARATGGTSGSEDLARTAIIIGWFVLVISLLPVCCMFPLMIWGAI